ncbi:MAG: hypothetical protein ABI391_02820 [Hyphomicrobiaceae bacterium]
MTSEKRLTDLTELESVLVTFGGDPGRWPANKRERMMGFAASDRDAWRLLREAEALDAVLTRAAGPPVGDTSRLAERIAAAAAGSAQSGSAEASKGRLHGAEEGHGAAGGKPGVVIAWPRSGPRSGLRSSSAARVADPTGSAPLRRDRLTGNWRTAAMMAASLLIGVFVGVMDLVPSEVTQFVAGVDSRSETTQALAFLQADGLLDFLDEGSK